MTGSTELTTADLADAANERDRQQPEPIGTNGPQAAMGRPGPLLPPEFSGDMRNRWETIQTGFVDDPRASVKEADELVANSMKKLAETFADARSNLEQQWSEGRNASTEDLRQALRRYRDFFQRLLAV